MKDSVISFVAVNDDTEMSETYLSHVIDVVSFINNVFLSSNDEEFIELCGDYLYDAREHCFTFITSIIKYLISDSCHFLDASINCLRKLAESPCFRYDAYGDFYVESIHRCMSILIHEREDFIDKVRMR